MATKKKNAILSWFCGLLFLIFLFMAHPNEFVSPTTTRKSSQAEFPSPTQTGRLQRLEDTCRRFAERSANETKNKILEKKIQQTQIRFDVWVGDSLGRLSYCHVPKVASTAWMSVMARLNGFSAEQVREMAENSRNLHPVMLSKFENKTRVRPAQKYRRSLGNIHFL